MYTGQVSRHTLRYPHLHPTLRNRACAGHTLHQENYLQMPPTPRRKACLPCAASKRRCDKSLPACQRCVDRDADCAYPQVKRRGRIADAGVTQDLAAADVEVVSGEQIVGDDAAGGAIGMDGDGVPGLGRDWSGNADVDVGLGMGMGASLDVDLDLDFLMPDMLHVPEMPFVGLGAKLSGPALPVPGLTWPAYAYPSALNEIGRISFLPGVRSEDPSIEPPWSWLLSPTTWALQHCTPDPVCTTFIELEPFIADVQGMLKEWVTVGRNSFIHARLYEHSMPGCLQDAFVVFAAYEGRVRTGMGTVAVKETLLRIAEGKMEALVCAGEKEEALSGRGSGSGAEFVFEASVYMAAEEELRDRLARVQALFVYVFVLLFDGSVRARGVAERRIPVLRAWLGGLWKGAREFARTARVDALLFARDGEGAVPGRNQRHGGSDEDEDGTPGLSQTANLDPNLESNLTGSSPSGAAVDTNSTPLSPIPDIANSHNTGPAQPQSQSPVSPTPLTQDEPHVSTASFTQATSLWHLYILTESLRRTYLVIDTTLNLYVVMKDGWAECGGAVLLSGRKALWDASRVGEWWESVNFGDDDGDLSLEGKRRRRGGVVKKKGNSDRKGPLMVSSKMPGTVIDECRAGEVDGFVRLYWRFVVGRERVEWWEDRDRDWGRD